MKQMAVPEIKRKAGMYRNEFERERNVADAKHEEERRSRIMQR